jgi:hypothetical protein
MAMSEYLRRPHRRMQVHNEYPIVGHFHHLPERHSRVGKTRRCVDQDSGIPGAVLSAFRREIQDGHGAVFFVQVDRNQAGKQRLGAISGMSAPGSGPTRSSSPFTGALEATGDCR